MHIIIFLTLLYLLYQGTIYIFNLVRLLGGLNQYFKDKTKDLAYMFSLVSCSLVRGVHKSKLSRHILNYFLHISYYP